MKNIIITGSNGTIGKSLITSEKAKDFHFIPWNRNEVSVQDVHSMEKFILSCKASALVHLAAITSFDPELRTNSWHVNTEWPAELAQICRIYKISFVFISSAMVFTRNNQGPYTPESFPDAEYGYGYEKRKAEEMIWLRNKDAVILRLGWQIDGNGDNTMTAHADREMILKNYIEAESTWYPSCSFISDTINQICRSLNYNPGTYLINQNQYYSYFEILCKLKALSFQLWNVHEKVDVYYDQRMMDTRIHIHPLFPE